MPEQKTSAFMPDLNMGPFSAELDPRTAQARSQPIQVPNPNGRVPRMAAAAAILDKFMSGVGAGRERNFRIQQQEQQQQVAVLSNKINQIANDPTRTQADKQAAIQPLYKAYGIIMGGTIEGGEGQKKGKGKGKGSAGGGEEQPQGVGHHVLGMFKELATGMAGGHFPKELNAETMKNLVGGALVDSERVLASAPNLETLTSQFNSNIAQAAQGVQGKSWGEAAGTFDQYRDLAMKIDSSGKLWGDTEKSLRERAGPDPGTKEYFARNPEKWVEQYKLLTGKEPTEEAKEDFFTSITGVNRPTRTTYGKTVKGSDVADKYPRDVFGHETDPAREYAQVLENGRPTGITPVQTKQSATASLQATADDFYRERNKMEPGAKMSHIQHAEAVRDYKQFLAGQAQKNPVLDLQAWDFLLLKTFDVKGIGNSATEGAQMIVARSGQIMDELGLTPGDVFALRSEYKSESAGLARVITQGDVVSMLEYQLDQNMDIARKLDADYQRSGSPLLNRVLAAFKTGTGDVEANNLAAQLHTVAQEWAKLNAGSIGVAGVPVKLAEAAEAKVSAALSSGQLASLFEEVISKDAKTRGNAVERTRREALGRIRGLASGESGVRGGAAEGASAAGANQGADDEEERSSNPFRNFSPATPPGAGGAAPKVNLQQFDHRPPER